MSAEPQKRTTEQGNAIGVAVLRRFLKRALEDDALADTVNELLFDRTARDVAHLVPEVSVAVTSSLGEALIERAGIERDTEGGWVTGGRATDLGDRRGAALGVRPYRRGGVTGGGFWMRKPCQLPKPAARRLRPASVAKLNS